MAFYLPRQRQPPAWQQQQQQQQHRQWWLPRQQHLGSCMLHVFNWKIICNAHNYVYCNNLMQIRRTQTECFRRRRRPSCLPPAPALAPAPAPARQRQQPGNPDMLPHPHPTHTQLNLLAVIVVFGCWCTLNCTWNCTFQRLLIMTDNYVIECCHTRPPCQSSRWPFAHV